MNKKLNQKHLFENVRMVTISKVSTQISTDAEKNVTKNKSETDLHPICPDKEDNNNTLLDTTNLRTR